MDDHCHLPLCEATTALIEKQGKSETDGLRCEKRVSEKIADETTAIIGRRSVELQSGFIPLHDGSKIEEALL